MSNTPPITRSYEPGIDSNGNDVTLDVSLHKAAAQGDLDLITLLLDTGSDINGRDSWRATALYRAVFENKPAAVRLLLSRGADALLKAAQMSDGSGGEDAITCAARYYKTEAMRELIAGGVPIHTAALYQATQIDFLNHSTPNDDVEMLRLLVDGTSGDFADMPRRAALEGALPLATSELSVPKVRFLMDRLDFDQAENDGNKQTVLDEAMLYTLNHEGVHDGFQYIEARKGVAAIKPIVEMLVDAGASVNVKDEVTSHTPLHFALQLQDIPQGLLEYLLDHNADVNAPSFLGRTPTFDMLRHPDSTEQLVKRFQEAGAKFDVIDERGNTPLHFVQNIDVARWLLLSGADPTSRNQWSETPLYKARSNGNAELVDVLLQAGALI